MKKLLILTGILMFNSCIKKKVNKGDTNKESTEIEIAQKAFLDIDSLLKIDNGRFWSKQLYGPIILINPKTRIFYSNENNAFKTFGRVNSIFSDTLPNDINIANTATNWEDKRWTMIMLPLPTNKFSRNNLAVHELFHRIQPEIGFEKLSELDNGHLDSYNGRLLLKLELQALEQALNSINNKTKLKHIKNALIFRNNRHENQDIKNAENSLELNEGLAEYTALMLSGRNKQEIKFHLSQSKNNFYFNSTFVRSFAYQTIPLYGYLLSSQNKNWHKEIDRSTNLTDYFIKSFGISPVTEKTINEIAKGNNYDYQQIEKAEVNREEIRLKRITELKIKFVNKPTLELLFQNMNISFDPSNIIPIENLGTVYPTLRVTDNWGILTVENEALLASDWSKVTVSEPTEILDKIIKGNGWKLELNPKWKVKKIENGFKLIKE